MTKKQRQKLIDDLLAAGQVCSNCCWSVGQSGSKAVTNPKTFADCAAIWDSAARAWHQAQARKL